MDYIEAPDLYTVRIQAARAVRKARVASRMP